MHHHTVKLTPPLSSASHLPTAKELQSYYCSMSTTTSDSATCSSCGSSSASNLCSGCREAYFCSRDCQVAFWPQHKSYCLSVSAKRDLATVPPSPSPSSSPPSSSSSSPVIATPAKSWSKWSKVMSDIRASEALSLTAAGQWSTWHSLPRRLTRTFATAAGFSSPPRPRRTQSRRREEEEEEAAAAPCARPRCTPAAPSRGVTGHATSCCAKSPTSKRSVV